MNPRKPWASMAAELVLFGKSAAQDNVDTGIERAQFIEDSVAVHDWQKEVENYQADLFSHFLIDSQRLKSIRAPR